jgi:hypothetical protein
VPQLTATRHSKVQPVSLQRVALTRLALWPVHVRVSSRVLTRWHALVTLPGVGGTREEAGCPRSDAEAARSRL